MTALNFVLSPDYLSLVTDTLCTVGPENKPCFYSSKVHAVPHLHCAFTMTGQGLFALECLKALMVRIIARDVLEADEDIPELYKELWQEHLEKCETEGTDMSNAKATVYHFGWVRSKGRVIGFEYKAENGFASERIGDGCWMHPNTVPNITVRELADLVRITKKQKKIDDALPPEQRAGIGGDFHHLYLDKNGIGIERVFRSSDFDKVFNEMVASSATAEPTNVHQ